MGGSAPDAVSTLNEVWSALSQPGTGGSRASPPGPLWHCPAWSKSGRISSLPAGGGAPCSPWGCHITVTIHILGPYSRFSEDRTAEGLGAFLYCWKDSSPSLPWCLAGVQWLLSKYFLSFLGCSFSGPLDKERTLLFTTVGVYKLPGSWALRLRYTKWTENPGNLSERHSSGPNAPS